MAMLRSYAWPGNVRELRNVLERAAVMCGERDIQPEDLRLSKDIRLSKEPSVVRGAPVPISAISTPPVAPRPTHHRPPATQHRRCPRPSQGHGAADDSGLHGAQSKQQGRRR
jgi:two-component system response regulator AtoC